MPDQLICAYCGAPILDDEDVAYPFVGNDNPTHTDCAVDAALSEVDDRYSEGGDRALEKFDRESDIQSKLLDN